MTAREPVTVPTSGAPRGFLARLAELACRRRGWVLLAWVVLLPAVIVLGTRSAGEFAADYSTPGSESKAAADLIAARFPGSTGDTIDVVWQAPCGVRDPAVEAKIDRFLARACQQKGVASQVVRRSRRTARSRSPGSTWSVASGTCRRRPASA
jgi:putative drug exporter of the RND superfamily